MSQAQLSLPRTVFAAPGLTGWPRWSFVTIVTSLVTTTRWCQSRCSEAAGEQYWPGYFDTVAARLAPGGEALIQSITIDDAQFEHYRRGTDFIQQFIFPGGMLPGPARFQYARQGRAGLGTVESFAFGRDYAETLRRWRSGFEATLREVRKLGFDEPFIRIWRMYLAYCEVGFDSGRTDVMHFHLRKAG